MPSFSSITLSWSGLELFRMCLIIMYDHSNITMIIIYDNMMSANTAWNRHHESNCLFKKYDSFNMLHAYIHIACTMVLFESNKIKIKIKNRNTGRFIEIVY